MKDHLIFDTTDANTIVDSDSVGAFLRASDGTLLTHTDVGGKKALDVRVAEGINIEVDLSHVDDSVRLGDGTTLTTVTTVGADNGLDVNIINASVTIDDGGSPISIDDNGGSLTVDAVDLDIRNLVFATDKVDVSGSTLGANSGVDIGDVTINNAAGASAVNIQDGGNSITVDAVQLDIDNLNATDDAVQAWMFDGVGNAIGSTAGAIDVNIASGTLSTSDAALANTAIAAAANPLSVALTAEDVVVSPLANRKYLFIYNNGNRQIHIGQSGVSAATGFPVSPGSVIELRAGAAVDIEWVGVNTAQEIRTLELS